MNGLGEKPHASCSEPRGAALAEGQSFCFVCGTKRNSGPSSSMVSSRVAPAAAPAGKLIKVALIVAALIMVILMAAMGSCVYIAYRAKNEAQRIEATHQRKNPGKATDDLGVNGTARSIPLPRFPRLFPLQRQRILRGPPLQTAHQQTWVVRPRPLHQTEIQSTTGLLRYERTEGGPEADLVVRTGDINNLGFGWPKNFDPSAESTPPLPAAPKPGSPDGTDRICWVRS